MTHISCFYGGSEVVWDPDLIYSKLQRGFSAQFVCWLVWPCANSCQLPLCLKQSSREQTLFCARCRGGGWGGQLLEAICIRVRPQSTVLCVLDYLLPLQETCMWARVHTHKHTLALRCRSWKDFLNTTHLDTNPCLAHSLSTCTSPPHTHTRLTYCSQTNTTHYLPRSCSSPSRFLSQAGTRSLLVAPCVPRRAERSVELSVINLLQHSL